jgi:uncharacterized protein (TIGR02466 family)
LIKALFPTFVYSEPLLKKGVERFNADLAKECRALRSFDKAGRAWSKTNYPGGYTSYASLNELHRFSSTFAGLERRISRCVKTFAKALDMDLRGRAIHMTDCWVNIMPPSASHSLHLHPLAFVSGTYYVATPPGCPGLKFEDPRLDRFMAAPPRLPAAKEANQAHVTYPAQAGNLILFESWLRHGVAQNKVDAERISISFNYNWR